MKMESGEHIYIPEREYVPRDDEIDRVARTRNDFLKAPIRAITQTYKMSTKEHIKAAFHCRDPKCPTYYPEKPDSYAVLAAHVRTQHLQAEVGGNIHSQHDTNELRNVLNQYGTYPDPLNYFHAVKKRVHG